MVSCFGVAPELRPILVIAARSSISNVLPRLQEGVCLSKVVLVHSGDRFPVVANGDWAEHKSITAE